MNEPLVSILLPTHNGARFIRRAIESVRTQSFKNWELIIVNDGSTDTTGVLATEIAGVDERIKVFRFTKNMGIQKALNEGLIHAKGTWVARIDDDDVWADAKKLEQQVAYLTEHPDCVLLGTGVIVQNEEGNELFRFTNPETDQEIRRRMLYRNCFSHSTVLFSRAAAARFNGYSESEEALHVEDYDLWLKLGSVGTMANLPNYSVRFTQRPGAITAHNRLTQFRRQLAVTKAWKKTYPGHLRSRVFGYLRLGAYRLLGAVTPISLQNAVMRRYKKL